MPETPPIADAARLAAQAPAGGVLEPRDDSIERAYLDLRNDPPAVARGKLATVAAAFAPRLHLQAGLKLLIAAGELNPEEAARVLAEKLHATGGEGSPAIAVVRGEDVLGRLEELIQADCVYQPSGRSLVEERRPVASAWAPPPSSVLEEAFEQNARVVIGRCGEFDKPPADSETLEVQARLVEGYRLSFHLPSADVGAEALALVEGRLNDMVEAKLQESTHVARIVAASSQRGPLVEAAGRLELAMPAGTLARPLASLIVRLDVHERTLAPASLFDFAIDQRPANEWLGDTPDETDR